MKRKLFIILGVILLVCVIVLGGLYISGASGTATFDKQLNLGNKYLLEANYEKAIVAFEKAIKIEPKSVDARLGLAKAYIAVDKSDDAVSVLEDAMEIDQKRPEPYIDLAKIYIDHGELEKAIEILEAGMKNSVDASIAALLDEIKPKAPMVSVESGKYSEAITLTFEGITENDEVYYTLDDTPPNRESIKYSEPISLTNGSHILRAAAYRSNGLASAESIYEYQIDIPSPEINIFIDDEQIFSVDGIVLGKSDISEAKAKYSGRSDYMSNLMNDDSKDTVYSMPYFNDDNPDNDMQFGYLFVQSLGNDYIEHIYISSPGMLCMGKYYVGDDAATIPTNLLTYTNGNRTVYVNTSNGKIESFDFIFEIK